MLAEFPVDGLADVKSLKQDLQRKCGVPRFRQRLMNAETILDDDTRLVSPMDVHLISLPFISASGEQRDELIELIFEDAVAQVEEILQRPQDPDLTASEEGENPLMLPIVFAASLGHTEIVRLLAEARADINELGGHGHPDHYQESATALIKACEHGHLETSRVLLELGACVDEYEGAERATALIRAAEPGACQHCTSASSRLKHRSIRNSDVAGRLLFAHASETIWKLPKCWCRPKLT